jgi:membrane-bound lytic murein transglycosylase B
MLRWIAAVALAVVVCVGTVHVQEPPPVAPVATPPPFDEWLSDLRAEAIARGIRREIVDEALGDLKPVEQILERDRTQAEFALDLDTYLERRLTRLTVRTAQRMMDRHRALLKKITAKYDVPGDVIIAVWGLESNFGRFAGVRPTIAALVTLAYDPRRASLFRQELFNALEIVNRGDIELARLKGSWAGALGQPQFMPSSYLKYAQDFDADGRRDIWSSLPDVFASIAYFLQQHRWKPGQLWGREVRVPEGVREKLNDLPRRPTGCRAERLMTTLTPLEAWRKLGLKTSAGGELPKARIEASLVPAGSRFYLVYGNYDALLGYNCAHSYALSIALLADRIR